MQLTLAFPMFCALWTTYTAVMARAASAADALAAALEAYLRAGGNRCERPGNIAAFHASCDAAEVYTAAVRAAEPWHFGTIPSFRTGEIVNLGNEELRAFLHELRGSIVYRSSRDPRDPRRIVSAPVSTDNGIAGFFRSEVRCMARFGSPRRAPSNANPASR
jgi:hypothetical protein